MAKKWSEVAASAEYRALPIEQKDAARQEYFNSVVAPQVPPEHLNAAREEFDSSTKPSAMGDAAKSLGTGVVEGTADLIGQPRDLLSTVTQLGVSGISKVGNAVRGGLGLSPIEVTPENRQAVQSTVNAMTPWGGGADIKKSIEGATGPLYQPQTTAGEYGKTVGQFLPAAAAMAEGPAAIPGAMARYGLLPALTSETAGQATKGTAAEPYARVAGALAAPLVEGVGRRIASPLPSSLTPEQTRLIEVLQNEGVNVTAGQRTGNKSMKWLESTLGDLPGADVLSARSADAQARQYNRSVLSRAGENADYATPDVIAGGNRRLGNEFTQLSARNTLQPDAQFAQDLTGTVRGYMRKLDSQQRNIFWEDITAIRDRLAQNNGNMRGADYQEIRSDLSRRAKSATDPTFGNALRGLRNALDSTMERSIAANNPADLGGWVEARRQYGNLKSIEKAMGSAEASVKGNISGPKLNSVLAGENRSGYAQGQGELNDIARAGSLLREPQNSGTPARLWMQGGAGAATGFALGGVPGAVAGVAAPSIAAALLHSRPVQGYLGNQAAVSGRTVNQALIDAMLGATQPALQLQHRQ